MRRSSEIQRPRSVERVWRRAADAAAETPTVDEGVLGAGPGGRRAKPVWGALLLTAGYTLTAVAWLIVSGLLLWSEIVRNARATVIVIANGTLFVVFTTAVLFSVIYRYLRRLRDSEARFIEAQAQLRQKDLAVRQGYVDVLDAVTGGKLILVTEDELRAAVGEPVLAPQPLTEAKELSSARRTVAERLSAFELADTDSVLLAVSEALTNAVKHGGHGEYAIYRSGRCLQVVVRDYGPGIDFRELPKATLIQGFSTTSTMGLGFTIMLEVSDRVLLTTDTTGTVVVLEIESRGPVPSEPARSLAEILNV